jgi:hypothetical protein
MYKEAAMDKDNQQSRFRACMAGWRQRWGAEPVFVRSTLIILLLLGLSLRLWGINWGLPHPDLPRVPDHYDEYISVRTLQQINRHGGDLNPEEAHLCGTLVFFTWHSVAEVLNAVGIMDHLPTYFTGFEDPNYGRLIIAGRLLIVAVDLCTLFLLFVLARRWTGRSEPGLWAVAFYAILPFQVIHTHFMRPHVVGNLFVVLMLLMALQLSRRPLHLRTHLLTGVTLGLAMASLYQLFALAVIPYLAYLITRFSAEKVRVNWRSSLGIALNWRLFALAGAALLTFFIGCPFLFLDYETAQPFIEAQSNATDATQFTGWALLDMSKVWPYLINALPMALFSLILPAYLSVGYVLTRGKYRTLALPTFVFAALYTYYATKGYGLFAARALLYLYPILALWTGLLLTDGRRYVAQAPKQLAAFWLLVGITFLPAGLYTTAYVRAFANEAENPYRQVHRFFNETEQSGPLRVGFIGWEWDRYHVFNMEQILSATPHEATVSNSRIDYFAPDQQHDYVIIFDFDSTMTERVTDIKQRFHTSSDYVFVTTFERPLALGRLQIDYLKAPTDFRYPFPRIHLFQRNQGEPNA